ncbi:hypothetical protein ACLI08_16220 [Flavobacterium sp. RNTU_13]|uniref:hypothetical protein n=1 Tax=Flavobacterium sp. RNTU_13 TaxID=3375145 RepID=UPI003985FCF7
MQTKRFNIPGFTVIEAVIGMVVTALVIAIIFVVFTITSERLLDFKEANSAIVDRTRIVYALNKDIFDNESFVVNEEQLSFLCEGKIDTEYIIEDDILVRVKEDFKDTFRLKIQRFVADTLVSKSGSIHYNRLQLITKDNNINFYKKIYPADLVKKYMYEH